MYNYITYVIFYTNTTSIKTVKTTVVLTVLIEAVLVITRYMNELSYRLYNIQYRPPLPVTLGTSCKRSIKANALLVCMALLQACSIQPETTTFFPSASKASTGPHN